MQTLSVLGQKLQDSERVVRERGSCPSTVTTRFVLFLNQINLIFHFSLFLFRFFLTRPIQATPASLMSAAPPSQTCHLLLQQVTTWLTSHPFKSLHKRHLLARPSLSHPHLQKFLRFFPNLFFTLSLSAL